MRAAQSLLQRLSADDVAGEVLCVVAELRCYLEPLLAANELRVQAEKKAISVGDATFSCLCR